MISLGRRLCLAALLLCLLPASASAVTSPVIAGSVSDAVNLSGTTSVAVSGHYAYATAYHAGELTAVDISNPASPAIVGESSPFLNPNLIGGSNVAISGGYAFVVSKNRNASTTSNDDGNGNSLTILDVHTDPTHPAILGTVRDPGKLFGSYGIAVSGQYAYVAYQGLLSGQPSKPDPSTGGFSVIDISTLGSPVIVANLDNGALPAPWTGQNLFNHSTSVAVSGHYAYVTAFNSARLTTIDITNPSSPQIVGSIQDLTNLAFPADLAVQGSYAYVADQTGGSSAQLTVVDLSNPASPRVAAELSNAALNGAYRIRVRGNFAYISGSSANTVATVDISTPTAPRATGFAYDATRLRRTTGLDLDSTGAYAIASSPYSPTESNATYPPYPDSGVTGSPTNTGTITIVNLDPAAIAVTISAASEPANPTTQTTANFSFSVNDTVSTVQCRLDAAAYGPCTSATTQQYSGLGPGAHTFAVQGIDSAGRTSTKTYTWTVQMAPANTGTLPSVSGTPAVGQTLTASPGGWSGSPTPTFGYQWQQCNPSGTGCTTISGATSQTYVVQPGDAGQTLVVVVTGSNSVGSASSSSGVVGPVAQAPANTGAQPSISGSPVVGQTLTASPGGWSGSPAPTFGYVWQQCNSGGTGCVPISGATSQTYVVQPGDAGQTLMVVVTGSNSAGSAPASSGTVGPVGQAPANSGALPSISGSPVVGQTLTASPGGWSGSPAPTFGYVWQQCNSGGTGCVPISGATSQTYVVQPGDAGQTLMVVVTGSNSAGSAPASSGTVGPVGQAPANSGALPSISGSPVVGQTLTASPGGWSGSPAPTFGYVWQQCNSGGTGCVPISGATSQTYVVQPGDAGQTLMVVVTGSNSAGSAPASSGTVGPVGQAPANSGALPSISGSPVVGQTLTASPGGWSGSPAPTFTYQWQQCNAGGTGCAVISGATNGTYTAQSGDAGQTLVVVVTGSNSVGSAPASSGVVGPVGQAPSNSGALPSISGSPVVGQTLTASPGGWSGSPAPTFTYQWQQCNPSGTGCVPISGATSQTYVVQPGDAGQTLMVVVTGSNSAGSAPASSGVVGPVGPATQAPSNSGARPSISGSALVGQTLTASPGGWSGTPAPSFTYQWQQCNAGGTGCAAISGATAPSFVLRAADAGHTLIVSVTGTNSVGFAVANSNPSAPIQAPPANPTAPTLSGTAAVGSTLTSTSGTWTGYPTPTLTYAWWRCNSIGQACATIPGATATTYTIVAADVGFAIRFYVRGTNSAGTLLNRSSNYTAVVPPAGSATAIGLNSGSAMLRVSVQAGTAATAAAQVTIGLPAGMRFALRHELLSALKVTGKSGHRLAFRAVLRGGALVLSLDKAASLVTVSIKSAGLSVTHALRTKVTDRPGMRELLRLSVRTPAGQLSHETVSVKLS